MPRALLQAATAAALLALAAGAAVPPAAPRLGAPIGAVTVAPGTYPPARRGDAADTLGSTVVPDPYRWMETPDSPEVQAFIAAQNNLTASIMATLPTRPSLKTAMGAAYDYEKWGTPFRAGGRYFYRRNAGLKNQPILYCRTTLDGPPAVVLDPNLLRADGTVALQEYSISHDGRRLAAAFSTGGSDWRTVRVFAIGDDCTGTPLPDTLAHVKFTDLSWTRDGLGFFYSRYDPPAGGTSGTSNAADSVQQLWYHVVGTNQTSDTHIFSAAAATDFISATATGDGVHLIVSAESTQSAARSRLLAAKLNTLPRDATTGALNLTAYDLRRGKAATPFPWQSLPTHGGYEFRYVAGYNETLYFLTTWNAPRYRVVKIDVPAPPAAVGDYTQVVPEHAKDLLQGVSPTKGPGGVRALVLTYLHDVKGALRVVAAADGAPLGDVPLPGPGAVSASTDRDSSEIFFKFASFVNPGTVYKWDASTPTVAPTIWKTTTIRGIDLTRFTTTQVFIPSKDGRANIPLFITAPVGMTRDGSAPAVLYGYGGFNIVNGIEFQPDVLVAGSAYGSVYASCNMRGGGEYGERWHADGIVANKQNTYDDFVSCAEYLVAANYTSPAKLSIHGGSFGGTLVAVAANQRPDLFGCVLSDVPVTDIARFHKFTVGVFWKSDYGDPELASDRPTIMSWSPLHNIKAPPGGTRNYPAILVSTAEFDDRVPPLHSLKYAATLQHDLAGTPDAPQRNALLLRVETQAGHGAGKPMSKHIADATDKWAFCMSAVGAKWTGPDPAAAVALQQPQREEDAVAQAAAAAVGDDGINLLG